jgi:hypothetical protein
MHPKAHLRRKTVQRLQSATVNDVEYAMLLERRIALGVVAAAVSITFAASAVPASAHQLSSRHESRHGHGANHDMDNGLTTVVLNQGLVPALVGLGVAPVAPGTLTAPNNTYQVAFPITEAEHGRIKHSGGLEFTKAAAGNVKITRFVVDTKSGFLTARTSVNGSSLGRIAIFKLGPVQETSVGVIPACSGVAAGLTLTPTAAGALLGDSTATAFIGDACIVPSGDDD